LGIGDWGLGIGPNPQSPIPNPHPHIIPIKKQNNLNNINYIIIKSKIIANYFYVINFISIKLKNQK
jgi:hypothetical protein